MNLWHFRFCLFLAFIVKFRCLFSLFDPITVWRTKVIKTIRYLPFHNRPAWILTSGSWLGKICLRVAEQSCLGGWRMNWNRRAELPGQAQLACWSKQQRTTTRKHPWVFAVVQRTLEMDWRWRLQKLQRFFVSRKWIKGNENFWKNEYVRRNTGVLFCLTWTTVHHPPPAIYTPRRKLAPHHTLVLWIVTLTQWLIWQDIWQKVKPKL